jgi:peptidoglycan hydrolase-like protein with peptidoglycan-binding domain
MMTEAEFKKLPLDQRRAHQERLQALGLYTGKIDGNYGAGTASAFKQEAEQRAAKEAETRQAEEKARADKLREEELAIERKRVEQQGASQAVANKSAEEKQARQAEYSRQASSPEGMAAQSFASIGMPALAGAAGLKFGDKVNQRMDRAQEARNETLRGAAENRVKGLTTRDGAVKGVRLAGAMPYENPVLRSGSRMAPHFGLGALSAAKGYQLLSDVDEDQPFYPRMADRGAGLGYLGFAGGVMKRGIEQATGGALSPDAQALSVINSNQLRRNGSSSPLARTLAGVTIDAEAVPAPSGQPQKAPPTAAAEAEAPSKTLTPGTKAYMAQQARDLKIKGYSTMNKSDLAKALADAMSEHGTKRTRAPRVPGGAKGAILGPLGAAGLAYAATPSDAQAATGEGSVTGQDAALTNAGIVGGGSLLASKMLPALAMESMGPAAVMSADTGLEGPTLAATMENIGRARGQASHYAPGLAEMFGVPRSEGTAYDITENSGNLPTPNPLRTTPSPGNQYYPNSASIGEQPQPQAQPPGGDVQQQIQLLAENGVPPDLIAAYLNMHAQ